MPNKTQYWQMQDSASFQRSAYPYFVVHKITLHEFGKNANSHGVVFCAASCICFEFCLATTGVCVFRCDNFCCRTFLFLWVRI